MSNLYSQVREFKKRYPLSMGWRTAEHCKVIEQHLNDDEEVVYAFTAQKNDNPFDVTSSCVIALTTKRMLIGQKRVMFGYFFNSITPDLYNDLEIKTGIIWGKLYIDTVKEVVVLSNISKRALIEIETQISQFMIEQKKNYPLRPAKVSE